MKKVNPSVLVGMSGGVDSSVAAALLLRDGYRVTGGFIKNWSDSKDLTTGECSWKGERRDAMRVAAQLGIPLLTFDFEKQYRQKIVDALFKGYAAGQTPNPDVLCNQEIKFGLFLAEARRLGFEYVATGHYARLRRGTDGLAHLLRGLDSDKDQSYFLYRVPQAALAMSIFPIGGSKKPHVRALAKKFKLPVAEKPDSQGICFIGKLDMTAFLRKKIPSRPGDIVDSEGRVLGKHSGLDGYTIGQRERIRVAAGGEPWYVADKDLKSNRLIIVQGADHPKLFSKGVVLKDLCWTLGKPPVYPQACLVQTRYRQKPEQAILAADNKGKAVKIHFRQPVKTVAPGQSAVIYRGNECLGGGIIKARYT
jgi:tRNA-specific 2-thiouridylase